MARYQVNHPLPASPIKGEVSAGGLNWTESQLNSIQSHEWRDTSPLMGEEGGGDCSMPAETYP